MLREILNIIYRTRMYSKSYIAKSLDIDEAMVEMAMEQLISRDYIREDTSSSSCSSGCGGCPMAKSCSKTPLVSYNLTDKGRKMIS